jgi:hypothetical protein
VTPSLRVVIIKAGHGTTGRTTGDGRVGRIISGDRRDWTRRRFRRTAVILRIATPSELAKKEISVGWDISIRFGEK